MSYIVGERKMEDGSEEIHDFVFAETKNLEGEEIEAKSNGLVKNLIVNLVPGNHGGEEGKSNEESSGLNEDSREEENQKEGGIMNLLISTLVSPRKSPTDERKADGNLEAKNEDHGTFKSEEESEGERGGGINNNLISSMNHHHDQDGRGEEEIKGENEDKAEEAGVGRSGGLVNELISHLPTPLAENAAPATDEASMLIHSIVHD